MSGFSLLEVQEAIFLLLSNDPQLAALGVTVADYTQENTAYPHITIGDDTAADLGEKDRQGMEVTSQLHFWSRARGFSELKLMMKRAYDLLHENNLSVAGQQTVYIVFDFTTVLRDSDNKTLHGIERFRIKTSAA